MQNVVSNKRISLRTLFYEMLTNSDDNDVKPLILIYVVFVV